MRALSIAASGMQAQQLNVDVISHNIANMNTVGFKRQRAEFQDLMYQNIERMGAQSSSQGTVVPTGIQVGLGVRTASTQKEFSVGTFKPTGNELDVSVQGAKPQCELLEQQLYPAFHAAFGTAFHSAFLSKLICWGHHRLRDVATDA